MVREPAPRAMHAPLVACVAAGALALAGCGTVLGIDDLVADLDDGAGSTSGSGGGSGCSGTCGTPGCGECPTAPELDSPAPGGAYRIAALEVTNTEYATWLALAPATSAQREECAWNDAFEPGRVGPGTLAAIEATGTPFEHDPSCDDWLASELAISHEDHPVACVDWCDAAAYCAWAGGHLCGRVGGGPIFYSEDAGAHEDADKSAWFRACSAGGAQVYPYPGAFDAAACNAAQSGSRGVGQTSTCEGGLDGLFDMSGNVAEWDDNCSAFDNPDIGQNCLARGGTWYNTDDADALACAAFRDLPRWQLGTGVGFRCCSTP